MKKPKHHYCHRVIDEGQMLGQSQSQMQVLEKIGEGSFGQVYKVLDKENSRLLVLKKSKDEEDINIIEEAGIMKELSNTEGFRRVAENSMSLGKSILMNCLGNNLGSIIRKNKKMNIFSMRKIAIQLIKRLQELHSLRYVHRDLKPENLVVGDKLDSHSIYLIDFGLVTPFRHKATRCRKIYNGLVGTAKFSSIASHQGMQQFPKDDLQSLGYILLFLVSGSLPWDKQKSENDEQLFKKILQIKKTASLDTLSGGFNCLRKYISTVKNYQFNKKIDYQELINIFVMGSTVQALSMTCFDFCEDCWVQKNQKNKGKKIEQQPRPNFIRVSIID